MITKVATVSIFVTDQDRAKKFYTEKLGMELKDDAPLYPGSEARWLSVVPKGADTEINLYLPDENWEHYRQTIGKSQSITLHVDNLDETYQTLKANGVKFITEPETQHWGTFAIIEDSEGNHLILVQA